MPNLDELKSKYAQMSQEQFDSLNREDLTEIAQQAYDRELKHRDPAKWKAGEDKRNAIEAQMNVEEAEVNPREVEKESVLKV